MPPSEPAATKVTTRIELPWRTVAKVLLTLVIIWLLLKLWSILLLVFIALLLTAALEPAVVWLQRRGLKRSRAVGLVFFLFILGIVGTLLLLIPPLIEEGSKFVEDLPAYVQDGERLLKRNPSLYNRLQEAADNASASGLNIPVSGFLSVGAGIVQGISNALIVIVMTIYLLLDGKRIYLWSVRYLPDNQERNVRQALPEISRVVSGYVVGQGLTSLMFGVFTFGVLSLVGVPQALFLAIVAAFMDAIPIAGVIIATIPAVLLALTVSIPAALIVFVSYMVYQQVENYIIVPRVYKKTLQVSSFAVLISVLIGAELLGIIGVLLALPIAAAIPVIEKIWIHGGPQPSSTSPTEPPSLPLTATPTASAANPAPEPG